jgi:hypothetical protein
LLCDIISGRIKADRFYELFNDKYSEGFDYKDLDVSGVVSKLPCLPRNAGMQFDEKTMIEK